MGLFQQYRFPAVLRLFPISLSLHFPGSIRNAGPPPDAHRFPILPYLIIAVAGIVIVIMGIVIGKRW